MDEKNGKNPFLALTVATMLFAALGVMVYTQAPYKGNRPSIEEIPEASQKIRARLWQDPFQAVLDYEAKIQAGIKQITAQDKPDRVSDRPIETEDSEGFYLSPCQGTTLEKELADKKNITILAVMVLGGPYDDDIEDRICKRYAVLSALNVLGYYPDDPTHIKYLIIHSSPTDKRQEIIKISFENIIPYEWLSSNDNKSVMLLWLNDDIFQAHPIDKLVKLGKNLNEDLHFKIIGPATSTTLLKMIKENGGIEKNDKASKLEIYSATATVDNDVLLKSANIKKNAKTTDTKTFFFRTILTDRKLANTLVKELQNRGINSKSHVVLVAEWDTDYGRSLPQIFKEVLGEKILKDEKLVNKMVHRFSYLRGIDGKLPGEQNGSDKDKKKNDENKKEERNVKKLEEPSGKSQYDYLRRLATRISHLEDQYGPGSIKAIGVLGNDFYDKFLVLQALGQRFPESIFFTTDLDARYLHPADIEWTRNLVVASTYGLQLREDLQQEVPPFRNAYQTSVFAATLLAFDYPGLKKDDLLPDNLKPRIFEIGRYNAIDLTNKAGSPVPLNQAYPIRGFPYWGLASFVITTFFISLLAMLLWLSATSDIGTWEAIRKFREKTFTITPIINKEKNVIKIWLVIFGSILVILIIFFFITINPTEEPFSWTEGISVWPTELIRFTSLILTIAFFLLSLKWLEDNKITIYDDFDLEYNLENNYNSGSANHTANKTITINNKWKEYVFRSTIRERYKWIMLVFLLYYVLCFIIIVLLRFPNNPVRGFSSSRLNSFLLLFIIIPTFLLLTFFVLDTIMLLQKFITQFFTQRPQWNENSIEKFIKKWLTKPEPSPKDSNTPPKNLEKWKKGNIKAALGEWMLVLLVARRTDVVGKLIFFPFIVWSLMIISRLHYFDNWHTPPGLVIVISLSAILAWIYAVNLRRSAEKLRSVVIDRLDQQLVGIYADDPENKTDVTCIQHVLNEVKAIKTGAFASYVQQPALQSLMVPLGSISGLKILELLSTLG